MEPREELLGPSTKLHSGQAPVFLNSLPFIPSSFLYMAHSGYFFISLCSRSVILSSAISNLPVSFYFDIDVFFFSFSCILFGPA